MNKILSWKITGGVYAYIYPVNGNSHISNRIAEDSPIWQSIISEISNWDASEYRANFDKMAAEVQTQYGYTVAWDDKFFDFVDENAIGGVNIVLLSGKDGDGVGGSGDGSGFGNGPGAEIIEEFNEMLQSKLDAVRDDIEKQNEEVKNFVEDKVSETISKAQSTINETKQELNTIKDELTSNLKSAQDALDKASALFDFEGEITSEDIVNALSSVKEYGGWLEEYSGSVKSLQTDYDEAKGLLGSIGESESVVDGLFSQFATSLNVISGTVGNVERSMNASEGMIEDFASWYDENASAVTEMSRFMSASAAVISDVVKYIDSDEFGNEITSKLEESMDAKSAEIKNEIMTETSSAITNVTNIMNGLSGVVETNITRMDTISGNLTAMGDKMNAMSGTMEEYMTQFNEVSGIAIDLRDSWSAESGKLSTVASLVAEIDDEGNIRYFVSSATVNGEEEILAEEIEVRKILNDDGTHYFKPIEGQDGTLSNHIWTEAYMKMSQEMGSYIQQGISSITMSVVGGENLTAAIKLAISGDSALIGLIANEVVIDATTIIKEIQSIKGTIGGIVMEDGLCYSMTKGTYNNGTPNPYFLLDGTNGKIYAENAEIKGSISADTGYIGGLKLQGNKLEAIEKKKHIDYYAVTETFSSCFSFNSGNTVSMKKIVEDGIPYQDIFVVEKDHPGLTFGNENTSGIFTGNTIFDFGTEIGYFKILETTHNQESGSYTYNILYCETKPYDSTTKNTEDWTENYRLNKTDKVFTTTPLIDKDYIKVKVNNSGYEGWKILGVESNEESDSEQTYALINSSNDYSDDKMGKLVIGAGPVDDQCGLNRYYKYNLIGVNSAVTEKMPITEIYLNKIYSTKNGDKTETEVEAYKIERNELIPIDEYAFYYVNEPYVESGNSGTTLYRDKIYVKSTLHQLLNLKNSETGGTYSLRNPEMVLGAVHTPTTDVHLRVEVDVKEDLGGGGGGTVTFKPNPEGTGGGSTGGGSTGGGSTSGEDLPNIVIPDIGYEKPSKGKDFINSIWDGSFTTFQVVRPVITIGQYEYSNESVMINTTDFNTKIYSDGTILSKNLIVDDGYFGGEINSNGVFKGELKDVTGTLKNVSITADTINSSFVINDEKSFNAFWGTESGTTTTYLKINSEEVSSGGTYENWTVDSFSWDHTNKNGTNAGKTYNKEKILLKVPINITSDTTINIPSMSGYVKRYTPRKKVNKESTIYVNCYVFYNDSSVETLFSKIVKIPETRGSQSVDFTTQEYNSKPKKNGNGFLIIEFGMNVHLSTYSWLGADKAAGHVYFNSNTSKVKVSQNSDLNGVHIGSNGISMFNESGNYGIIINDKGISLTYSGITYTAGSVKSGDTTMIVFK